MNRILEKWYHAGAPPVWTLQCLVCKRIYKIMPEFQKFICYCDKNEINAENIETETNIEIK